MTTMQVTYSMNDNASRFSAMSITISDNDSIACYTGQMLAVERGACKRCAALNCGIRSEVIDEEACFCGVHPSAV